MRNPFKRQLHHAEKPTLKERAAALKATAARVIRGQYGVELTNQPSSASLPRKSTANFRAGAFIAAHQKPQDAQRGTSDNFDCSNAAGGQVSPLESIMGIHETFEHTRRSVVVGSLAVSLPLPVIAAQVDTHPDAAVLAAAARLERATLAERAAIQASRAAFEERLEPVLRACPTELVISWRDRHGILGGLSWPTKIGGSPRFLPPLDGEVREAWTGDLLRRAIRQAVSRLGWGGRTPHRIREWKALLPAADRFDAVVFQAKAASNHKALVEVEKLARDEKAKAWRDLSTLEAKTPEGLAEIVRLVGTCSWQDMGGPWTNLLRSAANVSGVPLAELQHEYASTRFRETRA